MKDEEHLLLKEKARLSGLSMSAYVIKKCLEDTGGLINLFKRQE